MKGRIFITVIGLAILLVSVNVMAQVTVDMTPTVSGKLSLPIEFGGKFVYQADSQGGNGGGTSNKVAMIDCTHPHGLVQIAQAILPFYQTYAAMSVYNSQIEAERAIALQDIISTNETNQLFYNGALSSPWAPYILGSFGNGTNSYGSFYGSYGNSTYGAYSAGVTNARWN